MTHVIYEIVNKVSGKRYVGSALHFGRRKRGHLSTLRNGRHKNPHLQSSYDKYGEQAFEFIILEEVGCKEDLLVREQWWIDSSKPEYNICKVAGSALGVKHSPATRARMSASRKKLFQNGYKVIHSAGTKARISAGRKKLFTDGYTYSEETREKIRQGVLSQMNDATRARQITAQKKQYAGGRTPSNCKIINQLTIDGTFVKQWSNSQLAANHLGLESANIRRTARGRSKTCGGFKWECATV